MFIADLLNNNNGNDQEQFLKCLAISVVGGIVGIPIILALLVIATAFWYITFPALLAFIFGLLVAANNEGVFDEDSHIYRRPTN